jgi:hypothetical protein
MRLFNYEHKQKLQNKEKEIKRMEKKREADI